MYVFRMDPFTGDRQNYDTIPTDIPTDILT